MDCPSEDALVAVAEGTLPDHERAAVSEHLDRCDECRAVIVALVRDASAPVPQAAEAAALLAGRTWAGRYEVTGVLGQGGMGVVYAAWDRMLERRVALKVIRRDGRASEVARTARLLRESRAMARLGHPNVVAVFDVGTSDGQAYVAMELVEGGTLRQWLGAAPRAWPQVLAMFGAIGQGLVAAHDAGLVHRDLKPDNVLVDATGHPKVADFGLALARESEEPSHEDEPGPVGSDEGSGDPEAWLTRPGAVVGTPGYMAPEQRRGEPIDGRADVFALCVALAEALLGERPSPGQPLGRRDRTGRVVPSAIRAALRGGLHDDPRARTSLRALLAQLAVPTARRGRGVRLSLGLAACGAAALGLASFEPAPAPAVDGCAAPRAELAASWAPPRRERLAAAWGTGDDRRAWPHLVEALDGYVGRLDEGYAAACAAAGDGTPDGLRLSCLEQRRLAVGAAIELVAEGDPEAARAVDLLPSLEACREHDALARRMPLPDDPIARAEVERIRGVVASLRTLRDAGRYAEASTRLEPLLAQAERLGFDPLRAELGYELGVSRSSEGHGVDGARLIEQAALLAVGARHDALAAEAWIQLVHSTSEELHDYAAATQHLGHARTAVARLGDDAAGDEARARLRYYEAVLAWREGRYDDAMACYAEAIAMAHGVAPELELNAMEAKGILHVEQGEYAEALALHEEVLARRRALKGDLHPHLGFSYGNLATALFLAGHHREALAWGRKATALHAEMLGRRHPSYGLDLHLEAQILGELGELPQALALARQARELFEAARGPGHLEVATMIELEGSLRLEGDEPVLAAERLRESERIFADQVGDDALQTAGSRLLLAQALARLGRVDEAIALGERVIGAYARQLGPTHIRVTNTRMILGEILLDEGRFAPARYELERALSALAPEFPVGHRGTLRYLLARALLEPRSASDAEEGRRQLELAAQEIDEGGESFEHVRRLLTQWRIDHAALLR